MKFSFLKRTSSKKNLHRFDIIRNTSPHTLSLRPNDPRWFHLLFDECMQFLSRWRYQVLASAVLLSLIGGFVAFQRVSYADIANLNPTSCLGGWTNPHEAEGPPSLSLSASADEFTSDNSALLPAATGGEIFCGGFTGEIPTSSSPKKVLLIVSLSTHAPRAPITGDSFASSTGAILDASTSDPSFTAPAPDAVPAVTSDPAPAAPADSAPVDSLVSFLEYFTPVAHAETLGDGITITDVSSSTSASTPVTPPTEASSTSAPAATPTIEGPGGPGILEIRYTLDGTNWQTLETLDASSLVSGTFSLTFPASVTWTDLSSLQVSIRNIASIDPKQDIYLDGMTLAIEYGAETPLPPDPPIDLLNADLVASAVQNGTGNFIAEAVTGSDGKPALSFNIPGGGNLFIYRGASETPVVNSGMGDSPLEMPLYFFYPDAYTAIVVGSDDSCVATPDREACKTSAGFLGESTFTVSLTSSTSPPDDIASSTDSQP